MLFLKVREIFTIAREEGFLGGAPFDALGGRGEGNKVGGRD